MFSDVGKVWVGTTNEILGLVPERPVSAKRIEILFCFRIILPMYCLEQHFVLSLPYLGVKAQQFFLSLSFIFLDKKTLIKILLNPGLNLTIFQGTRSWPYKPFVHSLVTYLCNGCCLRHRWDLTLVKSICETALKSLFWAPAVYLDSKTVKSFVQ